jgi:hypothetical protein
MRNRSVPQHRIALLESPIRGIERGEEETKKCTKIGTPLLLSQTATHPSPPPRKEAAFDREIYVNIMR